MTKRRNQEVRPQPSQSQIASNYKIWKNRILKYTPDHKYYLFEHPIRTGECFLCKRNGQPQYSGRTYLHHLTYDDYDKLKDTIEVCEKCHYRVDPKLQKVFERRNGRTQRYNKPNIGWWMSRRY